MSWLGWLLLVGCLIVVFVIWDLVFCGGRYCKSLFDDGR
jgi:hypothetical protein